MSLTFDEIEWNTIEDKYVTVYVESSDYENVIKSVINGIPDAFPILNKETFPAGVTVRELMNMFGISDDDDTPVSDLSLSEQRLLLASIAGKDDTYSSVILVDAKDELDGGYCEKQIESGARHRYMYITDRAMEVTEKATLIWIKNNHVKMKTKVSEFLSDKLIVECTIKEAKYLKNELPDYVVNSIESIKKATVMLEGFSGKLPVNAESRTPTFAEVITDFKEP